MEEDAFNVLRHGVEIALISKYLDFFPAESTHSHFQNSVTYNPTYQTRLFYLFPRFPRIKTVIHRACELHVHHLKTGTAADMSNAQIKTETEFALWFC